MIKQPLWNHTLVLSGIQICCCCRNAINAVQWLPIDFGYCDHHPTAGSAAVQMLAGGSRGGHWGAYTECVTAAATI